MCPAVVLAGGEAPPVGFIMDAQTLSLILAVLLAISEGLAQIPAVKANGIFQLIASLLEKIGQPKGGLKG
jgi:hypothetical protein